MIGDWRFVIADLEFAIWNLEFGIWDLLRSPTGSTARGGDAGPQPARLAAAGS